MNNIERSHYYKRKSLNIQERYLSSSHPDSAFTHNAIGWIYEELEDYHTALEYFKKALAVDAKSVLNDNYTLVNIYNSMTHIYVKLNEQDKALSHLNTLLRIQLNVASPKQPERAEAYHKIGKIYEQKKDYKRALDNCIQSVNTYNFSEPSAFPNISDEAIGRVKIQLETSQFILIYSQNS